MGIIIINKKIIVRVVIVVHCGKVIIIITSNMANPDLTISEHAHNTGFYPLCDVVKFIDCDPHWHTSRVKEVIHIKHTPYLMV